MMRCRALSAALAAAAGFGASAPPAGPTASDIALAHQRSDQRDWVYISAWEAERGVTSPMRQSTYKPNIQDVRCESADGGVSCTYKNLETSSGIYFPCRARMVEQGGVWTFKLRSEPPPLKEDERPWPSRLDDQQCSSAYRSNDYTPPLKRVARPTLPAIKRLYSRSSGDPHAISSCKNKVRALLCVPVASDLAQYDCRYQDKHVGAREWVSRRTVIAFDQGWRYAEGDEPLCTIIGFDMGDAGVIDN